MHDYDLRNIPVLEDVIESDLTQSASSEPSENNPDFFPDESVDLASEDSIIESSAAEELEPQIGAIVDIIDDEDHHNDIEAAPLFLQESEVTDAEISDIEEDNEQQQNISAEKSGNEYDADETNVIESALPDYNADKEDDSPVIDSQLIKSIVDDITKQLMPDLEQHLRFLLQQALEDKLTDEVIEQINTKNDTP
jgi:hypothetical protein